MTHGKLSINSITDARDDQEVPFYNARPEVSDQGLQDKIDAKLSEVQDDIHGKSGPTLTKPLDWLVDILADNVEGTDWELSFRHDIDQAQMASGHRVPNPVAIGKLFSDFWIGDRSRDEGEIEILQYAQKVNLGFNNFIGRMSQSIH